MAETAKKGWPEIDSGRLLTAAERLTCIGLVIYGTTEILRPAIAAIFGF